MAEFRAAWWWIDRWRKSTAYTDMTAEEQGVYRNLLDELWLRDGLLPLSDKALAQISGDYRAWDRVREVVLARFQKTRDGYRNATHDEVAAETKARMEQHSRGGKTRAERAKRDGGGRFRPSKKSSKLDQQAGATAGDPAGQNHQLDIQPPDPSPATDLPSKRKLPSLKTASSVVAGRGEDAARAVELMASMGVNARTQARLFTSALDDATIYRLARDAKSDKSISSPGGWIWAEAKKLLNGSVRGADA